MSPPETPKSAQSPVESASREPAAVEDAQTPLTLQDGEAIRAALLERLEQSKLPERAMLINITKAAPNSIENGELKIGPWEVLQESAGLTLQLIKPSGGKESALWSAGVVKEGDQWKVKEIESGWIRRR
jgi:hypothetical protein